MKEYILIVEDDQNLCNIISQQLENNYPKYKIARFFNSKDALNFINRRIDPKGHRLVYVGTDEKLQGDKENGELDGSEFLEILSNTHPQTKKLIFSGYSDSETFIRGINIGIDSFVEKGQNNRVGDEFYNKTNKLISDYEKYKPISFSVGGVEIGVATTLYQKNKFAHLRFRTYRGDWGDAENKDFREDEIKKGMEWDEYDEGGIDKILLPNETDTMYIVAMCEGECVGGIRIIDSAVLPLETGYFVEDGTAYNEEFKEKFVHIKKGDKLELDVIQEYYPELDFYRREISRLIVKPDFRGNSGAKKDHVVLFGLFRVVEQLTKDQPTMFCTAKDPQIGLYQAVGFERIGPKIKYSLKGHWNPLMRNWWKAHHEPDQIPGMMEDLHKNVSEPIPFADEQKWSLRAAMLNQEAINRGYYVPEK